MHIEYLADCEENLDTIAEWQQSEFGHLNPAITLDQRKLRLRDTLKKRELPFTMVARSHAGEPIGAASLVSRTLTHPQLTPWLSMVVVPPAWRGRGIASVLSLKIADEARSMGFPSVHLFTLRHASLYEHLGWRTIEHSELNGIPITVMSRTTTV